MKEMFFRVVCKDHVLYIKHIFLYAVHPQTSHYSELRSNRAANGQHNIYLFFFQKTPCPIERCGITTTSVGQHLQKFHGLTRGTTQYAKLMMHSQKACTMYSKSKFTVYAFQQEQNTKSVNK